VLGLPTRPAPLPMPKPHDGRPEQQRSLAMDDQDTLFTSPAKREPWNKGKFTGAKPPRGRNMSGRSGASCKPRDERATDVQSGHRQQAPRLRCRCVKGRGHSLDTWCARANSKGVIQENRNVRCGSRADMPTPISDVCFTPESCRGFRRPARPLWAINGHQFSLEGEESRTLYASMGRRMPLSVNSATGSTLTALSTACRTRGLMRI
jgi:hypothetical protein